MTIIKCPETDYTCPYYCLSSGHCKMIKEEGCSPILECDAFACLTEEETQSYVEDIG